MDNSHSSWRLTSTQESRGYCNRPVTVQGPYTCVLLIPTRCFHHLPLCCLQVSISRTQPSERPVSQVVKIQVLTTKATKLRSHCEQQVWCFLSAGEIRPKCTFTRTSSLSQYSKEKLKRADFTVKTSTPVGATLPRCSCKQTDHLPRLWDVLPDFFHSHKETCDITYPSNSPFPSQDCHPSVKAGDSTRLGWHRFHWVCHPEEMLLLVDWI